MKTAALIKLIAWSVLALVLLGVLISGLNASSASARVGIGLNLFGNHFSSYRAYDESESYIIGPGNVNASQITDISIDWVDGRVDIVKGQGSDISFYEECSYSLDSQYTMRYYVDGSKLFIKYCAPRTAFRGVWGRLNKRLTVTIPDTASIGELNLNAVSSNIDMQDLRLDELDINSVSGLISIKSLDLDEADIVSVSGDIRANGVKSNSINANTVSGNLDLLSCDIIETEAKSVSGSVEVEPGSGALSVEAETVSGGLHVRIPENTGFDAKYSSMSGGFTSEFATTMTKNRAKYLDGGMKIELKSVSGDLSVEKAY